MFFIVSRVRHCKSCSFPVILICYFLENMSLLYLILLLTSKIYTEQYIWLIKNNTNICTVMNITLNFLRTKGYNYTANLVKRKTSFIAIRFCITFYWVYILAICKNGYNLEQFGIPVIFWTFIFCRCLYIFT